LELPFRNYYYNECRPEAEPLPGGFRAAMFRENFEAIFLIY